MLLDTPMGGPNSVSFLPTGASVVGVDGWAGDGMLDILITTFSLPRGKFSCRARNGGIASLRVRFQVEYWEVSTGKRDCQSASQFINQAKLTPPVESRHSQAITGGQGIGRG